MTDQHDPAAPTASDQPRRDEINRANGVITRHPQRRDGGPCGCGWPANGLPYAPSHPAHVAERLWDAGCLVGSRGNRVLNDRGYVDLDATYATGSPASNRLVAECEQLHDGVPHRDQNGCEWREVR